MGVCACGEDPVFAGSTSGTQYCVCDGDSAERDGGLGSLSDQWRGEPRPAEGGEGDSVEGTLLGASAVSAGACRSGAPGGAWDAGDRPPGVPLGGLPEGG